jgi:hypothetical protein
MKDQSRSNIGAYLLIGLGIIFLAAQTGILNLGGLFDSLFSFSWPFFVIIPGVVLLALAAFGKGTAGFAIPGTLITGTGLILGVQNATNYWESWAYVWALYPGMVGLAIMYMGWRANNARQRDDGRKLVLGSLVATAIFFAIFEGLIFNNIFSWNLLPVALIGVGAFLLFRDRFMPAPRKAKFAAAEKPKHIPTPAAPVNGKPRSAADIDPELRRKIDEALGEETPPSR